MWFAGHHTYLASLVAHLLRKRLIVALSDYDLANEPSFSYAAMRGGLCVWINNHNFRLADTVVVPSEFSYQLGIKTTVLGHMRQKLCSVPQGFQGIAPESSRMDRCMSTVGELSPEDWIRKGLPMKVAFRFSDLS